MGARRVNDAKGGVIRITLSVDRARQRGSPRSGRQWARLGRPGHGTSVVVTFALDGR